MLLKKHSALVKLTVFLLLVLMVAVSPLRKYLTIETMTAFINQFRANPYAALIYLSIYVAGVVLAVPGTALTILAAPLFGFWTGLLLVILGSNLGCQITFFASRYLGKDIIQKWIKPGSFLEKASVKIERTGLLFMLYIRLLPLFPFNVINYLSGLTTIKYRDYTLATFLGMLPGTLMYVYLSHTATDVKNNPYGFIVSVIILLVFSAGVIFFKKRYNQKEQSSHQEADGSG
ncbi:MAG: TVP38/TMEM64 family protein [Bacillota bacterium]|nr:TVP38/TMEM64 family protein [Bacillota bacterium]